LSGFNATSVGAGVTEPSIVTFASMLLGARWVGVWVVYPSCVTNM